MTKTLAFLQNMWARDPAALRASRSRVRSIGQGQSWASGILRLSRTGQRLHDLFGSKDFCRIIWENTTDVIGATSNSAPQPDPAHIADRLRFHAPDIVLLFGRAAQKSVLDALGGIESGPEHVISFPHPTSRHKLRDAEMRIGHGLYMVAQTSLLKSAAAPKGIEGKGE